MCGVALIRECMAVQTLDPCRIELIHSRRWHTVHHFQRLSYAKYGHFFIDNLAYVLLRTLRLGNLPTL